MLHSRKEKCRVMAVEIGRSGILSESGSDYPLSSICGETKMNTKPSSEHHPSHPPALLLISEPRPAVLSGHYDPKTDTWSNRLYEAAATKKHNEQQ